MPVSPMDWMNCVRMEKSNAAAGNQARSPICRSIRENTATAVQPSRIRETTRALGGKAILRRKWRATKNRPYAQETA